MAIRHAKINTSCLNLVIIWQRTLKQRPATSQSTSRGTVPVTKCYHGNDNDNTTQHLETSHSKKGNTAVITLVTLCLGSRDHQNIVRSLSAKISTQAVEAKKKRRKMVRSIPSKKRPYNNWTRPGDPFIIAVSRNISRINTPVTYTSQT